MTVSSRVTTIPWMIRGKKRYWPTTRQSRVGAAANVYRAAPASARTTTAETHRHGWRSGMALMASGRVLPLERIGSLTVAPVARSVPQYDGTQLAPVALLLFSVTAELVMAPSATPQVLRSFV